MESRAFIRHAQQLIVKIRNHAISSITQEENKASRDAIQKEINQLYSGSINPTLPSASRLCEVALKAGFTVRPEVQHRLTQAESCWT